MAVKVVDASAAGAILFAEPDGDGVSEVLTGHTLVAPELFSFELANICVTKMRRHKDQRDRLLHQFDVFPTLGIVMHTVNANAVVYLADKMGLTAYDASYLWLARRLDAELVTLDRKLAAVASRR
jgi:predicted nucleic acid-binding protein